MQSERITQNSLFNMKKHWYEKFEGIKMKSSLLGVHTDDDGR